MYVVPALFSKAHGNLDHLLPIQPLQVDFPPEPQNLPGSRDISIHAGYLDVSGVHGADFLQRFLLPAKLRVLFPPILRDFLLLRSGSPFNRWNIHGLHLL